MMSRPGARSAPHPSSERLHTAAALNNRDPILRVLGRLLAPGATVLEVGSGAGVHVAHLARHLPGMRWRPSDPDPAMRRSVAAWSEGLEGIEAPLDLDVMAQGWWLGAGSSVDMVLAINLLHVTPPEAVGGLLDGARELLTSGGRVALYGPFRFNGQYSGPNNARFHTMLRQQNPVWGVRDLNDISAQAATRGLGLERVIDMPAANHVVLLRRS